MTNAEKIAKELTSNLVDSSTDVVEIWSGDDGPVPIETNGGLPQTLDDLPETNSGVYDFSYSEAVSARIPVVGSIGSERERRVITLEWCAFKRFDEGNTELQVGYAIRLAVTIARKTRDFKLSLPFIAASAELKLVEAQWQMQVLGLAGPEIDKAITPPRELNVERYVEAQQSIKALVEAARDPSTTFHPITIRRVTRQ